MQAIHSDSWLQIVRKNRLKNDGEKMKKFQSYYEDILLSENKEKIIDNVFVQKLPGGYRFDAHMHPTVEVLVCLEGTCTIQVCQTEVEVREEEYIVLVQNRPHGCCVREAGGCVLLQMHFHPNRFTELYSDRLQEQHLFFLMDLILEQKNYMKHTCSEQLYHSIRYIYEESQAKRRNYQKLTGLYFAQILILLSRDMEEAHGEEVQRNRYMFAAFEYIRQHYGEKISVDELAGYCGISSRYLCILFQRNLGMSVSSYIKYYRINQSIEMMLEKGRERTLTEIALESGFGSLQHYSKVFKSTMDISPAKYFAQILKIE